MGRRIRPPKPVTAGGGSSLVIQSTRRRYWQVAAFVLVLLPVLALSQSSSLYVSTGPGTVKSVPLQPGVNVLQAGAILQNPEPQVVIGGALLATPNVDIGAQALVACQAGTVPPQPMTGGIPSCTANQVNAINADILARVQAALATIPAATLTANGLQVVQP